MHHEKGGTDQKPREDPVSKEVPPGTGNMRNYALIVLGVDSAFRISGILKLKWDDVTTSIYYYSLIICSGLFIIASDLDKRIQCFCGCLLPGIFPAFFKANIGIMFP